MVTRMLGENGRPLQQYRGARFYKSDLQMQTPFDVAHWVGQKFESPEIAAEQYIRRCYEVELEVIALTEHNFVSKLHIPLLQQKAKELSSEFGYELIIFPGFEFTANVGKGVHVLALFEPKTDLDQIDHILTACGVPHPRQNASGHHAPSTKSLDEITRIIQAATDKGGMQGLVILPHIQSNSGMFDDEKIADWLQRKEFTNPDLLAVEVPKSPGKMSAAFQKLFGNGDDCLLDWKRTRSICCIMSSDAKALVPNDKTTNYIGSKYTWIKMSTPSIEALRQAFLDHDSRVRRSDEHPNRPELAHTHPHLECVKVSGAKFLADEEIHFSQNLTTLIGGRGTGKSTLIEYIRIALQQEHALEADPRSQLYADFQNVRDTLGQDGSIVEVVYDKGTDFKNQKITLVVEGGLPRGLSTDFGDINTYLPVKIYSRGQIEAIANDPQKQASIIDDLVLAPLEGLKNEERDVVRRLKDLNESLRQESDIGIARAKLIADISNLNAQINAIKGKHSSLEAWSKWNAEKQYLASLETAAATHIDNFSATVATHEFYYKKPDGLVEHGDFLNEHLGRITSIAAMFHAEIQQTIQKAKASLSALNHTQERVDWQSKFDIIDADNKVTIAELAAMGVSFDAYDELFRRRELAQAQLATQEKRLVEISANREIFRSLYEQQLLDIWKRQFDLRSGYGRAPQRTSDEDQNRHTHS